MNTHSDTQQEGQFPRPLFDINAAAVYLDVSRGTVYRLVREGEIATVRVGSRMRIRPEAIDAYLERNTM